MKIFLHKIFISSVLSAIALTAHPICAATFNLINKNSYPNLSNIKTHRKFAIDTQSAHLSDNIKEFTNNYQVNSCTWFTSKHQAPLIIHMHGISKSGEKISIHSNPYQECTTVKYDFHSDIKLSITEIMEHSFQP